MPIYLDYNASAPLRGDVLALMQQAFAETGNASSIHGPGRAARARLETARGQVAALAGVQPAAVTFTSGATEANNAVLHTFKGQRVLVSAIEHPSVLEAAPDAERIPVDANGIVDESALLALIASGPPPALLSIMAANNETGTVQPVGRLAKLAKQACPSLHIHCDAVQLAGRLPIDFPAWHLDYMSLSAHKLGGPQGAGALITAPGAKPARLLFGGGQERRQRAGTENVAAIAGFGLAADRALAELASFQTIAARRDRLEAQLATLTPALVIHAQNATRLANTSLVSLPGIDAQTQVMTCDLAGIAVSSGAACSSGTIRPSHVLAAMGVAPDISRSALRISLGPQTTDAEIDSFLRVWSDMTRRLLPENHASVILA